MQCTRIPQDYVKSGSNRAASPARRKQKFKLNRHHHGLRSRPWDSRKRWVQLLTSRLRLWQHWDGEVPPWK